MTEFMEVLIIITCFWGFLITSIVLVILNPDKVDIKAKKKEHNKQQEVCVSLEKNENKKD